MNIFSQKSKVKSQKSENKGQTNFYALITNRGFALVSALIIMTLLAALGSAAYMMTNMGFAAVNAERRYQLANWSADYAIGAGASFVIDNAICPPSTTITPCASLTSGATCDYFSIPDVTGTFCTIYSKGKLGTAQVIKTAVVPRMGSDWGGMVTRGGTITLSGSSAVTGCDDDEASYPDKCGMMPALIAPPIGTNLTLTSTSTVSQKCDTEGKMKGLFGNPPHYQPEIPDDLVPKYFGVTDANNSGSAWDEFLGLLEAKYSVTLKDGSNNPTPPSASVSAPALPTIAPTGNPLCDYDGPADCVSMPNNRIRCGTPEIFLDLCPIAYVNTSHASGLTIQHNISSNSTILSTSSVTINNPSATAVLTLSDLSISSGNNISVSSGGGVVNIRTASSANTATVNANVSSSTIRSNGNIAVNAIAGDSTIISSNGNVTLSANVTGSTISATNGNVAVNANVSSSIVRAGNNITVNNNNITNSRLISGATATINLESGKLMQNTNVFATNLNFDLKGSGDRVAGGTFYALNNTSINSTGGPRLGIVANPILLLAGNTSMSVPGNLTINGLIYTTATKVEITGAVELQGSLINNSTTANISNTGNGILQFNKQVLDELYKKVSDLMNKPKCGGGNKKDWIANTKMTLY